MSAPVWTSDPSLKLLPDPRLLHADNGGAVVYGAGPGGSGIPATEWLFRFFRNGQVVRDWQRFTNREGPDPDQKTPGLTNTSHMGMVDRIAGDAAFTYRRADNDPFATYVVDVLPGFWEDLTYGNEHRGWTLQYALKPDGTPDIRSAKLSVPALPRDNGHDAPPAAPNVPAALAVYENITLPARRRSTLYATWKRDNKNAAATLERYEGAVLSGQRVPVPTIPTLIGESWRGEAEIIAWIRGVHA